jgi:hypothetical protein
MPPWPCRSPHSLKAQYAVRPTTRYRGSLVSSSRTLGRLKTKKPSGLFFSVDRFGCLPEHSEALLESVGSKIPELPNEQVVNLLYTFVTHSGPQSEVYHKALDPDFLL